MVLSLGTSKIASAGVVYHGSRITADLVSAITAPVLFQQSDPALDRNLNQTVYDEFAQVGGVRARGVGFCLWMLRVWGCRVLLVDVQGLERGQIGWPRGVRDTNLYTSLPVACRYSCSTCSCAGEVLWPLSCMMCAWSFDVHANV